jgi:hypothetical protein
MKEITIRQDGRADSAANYGCYAVYDRVRLEHDIPKLDTYILK